LTTGMNFYHIPDTANYFETRVSELLRDAHTRFEQIREMNSDRRVLRAYDDLLRVIEQVSAPASLFSNVWPDDAMRTEAEKSEQLANQLLTKISLDKKLFELIATIDAAGLNPLEQRLQVRMLRDFRRAGVDKDDATREKITSLKNELTELGQQFEKNIREDVRSISVNNADGLAGLPPDFVAAHQPNEHGVISISTDYPDFRPFMLYADHAAARRELFIKFNTRAFPKNESVLRSLLEKRFALAQLLGYSSWAVYVTEDKMIQNAAAVAQFIERINTAAKNRAAVEYDELLAYKRRTSPQASTVAEWESPYLKEKLRAEKFEFDSQAVRPYFVYDRVRDGLLALAGELYEIQFVPVTTATWHESVEVFNVNRGTATIGRIYLDMHPRENKYKHAAQFHLQSGVRAVQLPEGVLVCNFTDPQKQIPALMDHDQVTTFFHEFGHLMHHILGGNTEFAYFSGVATEWDFVEAPSQLFEEWAWDANVLARFAHHAETGESIPAALVAQLRAAEEFGKGLFTTRQLQFAALSLELYASDPHGFEIHTRAIELQNQYNQFPFEDDTHMECSFGHLDGYSAIYYTYLWSLVIAKDLFTKFEADGLLNEAAARAYRQHILEPGGSSDAAALINNFLGRAYTFDAFEAWLAK